MKPLDGLAAIVTGGGGGLGRCHARHLASLGAAVLVNDTGRTDDGTWLADQVADEIAAEGYPAASHHGDISDWSDARDLIATCVERFGRLDVLVNNAGIVRDRTMARMSEREWDDVVRVNLKGHAAPSAHAMAYWRQRAKENGEPVRASIVHTSSIGGLMPNFGQGNYTAAKLGIVALSSVLALEGSKIGVRSNAIAPSARTELAVAAMPAAVHVNQSSSTDGFDFWAPENVSPVVGWLATPSCRATGQVFYVAGNTVQLFAPPSVLRRFTASGRWTVADLERRVGADLPRWPTAIEFLESVDEAAMADG